ncbi:pyridoxamine 5'-phosphate oxidase family protein [Amycolatopsis sp. 195334CR]|uniref:pyridoxamine 5'-phosphate oxidase family protein n=1 Tax=Amycolatopsis sp. 195334CR TaxID=2814588 RepID=UPI001A8D5B20|nr:pyridoxamine 5'-phosphate oxidase family protein [Amycolatopsis sp. 195334CR]MBN6033765.1 pyridoxamine 5'-phosphate oxidase family protein [Amycolatopsis sp. 195334CR]
MGGSRAESLSHGECLRLLERAGVGRVVYTKHAMPAIDLVAYTMREGAVIIRSPEHSELPAALRNAVVAFQADRLSDDLTAGWTVSVVGHATEISDDAEVARLSAAARTPWPTSAADRFLKITVKLASGTRIGNGR